ncbi:MAG TPA: D-alanyl-D-alanine carboxypeptidase family protein [Burkholderiales bacterium]|nr:D-alanyl-D-alanine carboxypeptidase family protein [Burkholderiales bacterium]
MRSLLLLLLSVLPAALPAQQAAFAVPPAPVIAANAYLLLDFHSGQVLAAREPHARVEPASLTKLMTAYVAFTALKQKRIRADQAVPVSERAYRTVGSRMFIEAGKPVTVYELVRGMIVQSANDACIALAEAIAGSEEAFAEMMNQEARRMGLANTHFVNSTGLPHPQHYSTAQDIAALAAAVIRDFPEHYPLYSQKEYRYNGIAQSNRNRLLWTDPTVDGMKSGYTAYAGYCLVTSARRGERRLVAVVLGAASETARAAESQKLLNHGFQAYDGVRLYSSNQPVATFAVYKGSANSIRAGFITGLQLALPRGSGDKLKATIESMEPLLAPIRAGQRVGTLKLTLDDKPYRELPVVALDDVPVAGILGRGWDTLRLLFR